MTTKKKRQCKDKPCKKLYALQERKALGALSFFCLWQCCCGISSFSCCLKGCWSLLFSCSDGSEGSIGSAGWEAASHAWRSKKGIHCQQTRLLNYSPCKNALHSTWRCSGGAHKHHMEGAGIFSGLINNYMHLPNVVWGQWDSTMAVRWQLPQKWVAGRVMQLGQIKAKEVIRVESDFLNIHTFSYCVHFCAERRNVWIGEVLIISQFERIAALGFFGERVCGQGWVEAVYILFKYERNDHLEEAFLKALSSPALIYYLVLQLTYLILQGT